MLMKEVANRNLPKRGSDEREKERKTSRIRGHISRVGVVHLARERGENGGRFWPLALLLLWLFPTISTFRSYLTLDPANLFFSPRSPTVSLSPEFFSFLSLTLLSFFHLSCLLRLFRTICTRTPSPHRPPRCLFVLRVIHHVLSLVRNYFVRAEIEKRRWLSTPRVNYRSAPRLTRSSTKSKRTDLCPQPSLFLLGVMRRRLGGNGVMLFSGSVARCGMKRRLESELNS